MTEGVKPLNEALTLRPLPAGEGSL